MELIKFDMLWVNHPNRNTRIVCKTCWIYCHKLAFGARWATTNSVPIMMAKSCFRLPITPHYIEFRDIEKYSSDPIICASRRRVDACCRLERNTNIHTHKQMSSGFSQNDDRLHAKKSYLIIYACFKFIRNVKRNQTSKKRWAVIAHHLPPSKQIWRFSSPNFRLFRLLRSNYHEIHQKKRCRKPLASYSHWHRNWIFPLPEHFKCFLQKMQLGLWSNKFFILGVHWMQTVLNSSASTYMHCNWK